MIRRCAEEFPGPLLLPPELRATFSGASGGVGKQICLPFLAVHHLPSLLDPSGRQFPQL